MAFRSSEMLQRNELIRYQLDDAIRAPVAGQHQDKNGYKFTVNDRSEFYDWYDAYFEIQFQLQKLADGTAYGADRVTFHKRETIVLRLSKDALSGNDTLYVPSNIVKRLEKQKQKQENRKMRKGMDIKLAKTNIRKQVGGSLLTSIV